MLSDAHKALIAASAVSDAVRDARGYFTATRKAELAALGFSPKQRLVPALVIPIFDAAGKIVLHQARPDSPRKNDKGKPVKYETPGGAGMAMDVHPSARPALGNPAVPLFITEGIRKADAAVTAGLCCIGLLGVYNFRGKNSHGGKTLLPDWEHVALNDRKVYVVFDSDVMEKAPVWDALDRLRRFLESRGAAFRVIYLPPGDAGEKVGLDDFLAQGHGLPQLLEHARAELRPRPPGQDVTAQVGPYRVKRGRIFYVRTVSGSDGQPEEEEVPLTNFVARITADVLEDDGAETRRMIEIAASVQEGPERVVTIPAEAFEGMSWCVPHLGSGAVVEPGAAARQRARAAIQELSSVDGPPPTRRLYVHTGWREHEGEWVYLHGGGAIGEDGPAQGIYTRLDDRLARYELPPPPDDPREAIRTSLRLLEAAPLKITAPLVASIWRAPLGSCDFSVFLYGPTGNGKSELAALAQQHFGRGMTARNLPASWESTANGLEGVLFLAKDALLTIDDFLLKGSAQDRQRMILTVDRVLRNVGNGASRTRMRDTTAMRASKPPRALVLCTGEDLPPGSSLTARMLVVPITKQDVRWPAMTELQRAARAGVLAQAMAGYVRWLAPKWTQVQEEAQNAPDEWRADFQVEGLHPRSAEVGANLSFGLRLFVRWALESRAVTEEEADRLLADLLEALHQAVVGQVEAQQANDPVRRFFELVETACYSGRLHLAGPDGRVPSQDPLLWGWRRMSEGREARIDFADPGGWVPEHERTEVWAAQGPRGGWVEPGEREVWLMPEVSMRVARELAGEEWSAPSVRQLGAMLQERGILLSGDGRHLAKKAPRGFEGGNRVRVWHLRLPRSMPLWGVRQSQPE